MLKLFGALVLVGLALACLTSWVLDSYDTAWHPKRSLRDRGTFPPFPGDQLDNIFWFVQVGFFNLYMAHIHTFAWF